MNYYLLKLWARAVLIFPFKGLPLRQKAAGDQVRAQVFQRHHAYYQLVEGVFHFIQCCVRSFFFLSALRVMFKLYGIYSDRPCDLPWCQKCFAAVLEAIIQTTYITVIKAIMDTTDIRALKTNIDVRVMALWIQ